MMKGNGIMKRMLYEKPRAMLAPCSDVASLQPGQATAGDAERTTSDRTTTAMRMNLFINSRTVSDRLLQCYGIIEIGNGLG